MLRNPNAAARLVDDISSNGIGIANFGEAGSVEKGLGLSTSFPVPVTFQGVPYSNDPSNPKMPLLDPIGVELPLTYSR